jgi:hypothetical protein
MNRQPRLHFRNMHNHDTITVSEEGPQPHCPKCEVFQKEVGQRHQQSEACKQSAMCIEIRGNQEANRENTRNTTFTVKGEPIEQVTEFKYLGRMVTETDDDWCAINLKRAQMTWGRVRKILSQEKKESKGSNVNIQGSSPGCATVWVRSMGDDCADDTQTRNVSPQVRTKYSRPAHPTKRRWNMALP